MENKHKYKKQVVRVYVLYTGGTIGMAPEDPEIPGSPLVPKTLDELCKYMPGLDTWGIELSYDTLAPPVDSSNLLPDHWVKMAKKIAAVYNDYDGFVILHGTDTLSYTSSALAFMFENLAKPVVITGSQLPISDIRTDAVMNFANAVRIAGYRATGLPCVNEVIVVFADKILRGCRARKVSSKSWAGFESPNYPPLGHIGKHITINKILCLPSPKSSRGFQICTQLSDRVMDLAIFPGFSPSRLRKILLELDVDAVLLRTYGAGNAPTEKEFLDVIAKVIQVGKTIVNTTQCLEGMVEMGLYEASAELLERGVISALDMTPEATLTKLMWVLGTKQDEQLATQMQVSQRGEQSENLFDMRYGSCGSQEKPTDLFEKSQVCDERFDVSNLSKAVIRFHGFGFSGVLEGTNHIVRIFMNMPSADKITSDNHSHCIATIPIVWKGSPVNLAEIIPNEQCRTIIDNGDILLSIVVDNGVQFWFEGLYLSLFAKT